MKIKSILSTTHVDLSGDRMTREALEGMVQQIKGERKILFTAEHDRTLPPLGTALDAWIEPTDDGEFALVAVQEVFEDYAVAQFPNGTVLIKQESEEDHRPFVLQEIPADAVIVASDPANFGSPKEFNRFFEEIRGDSEVEFIRQPIMRKSWLPDPELVIRIGEVALGLQVTRKVLEKAQDNLVAEIADDLSKLYRLPKSAIVAIVKHARPKNRPITYVFEMDPKPFIELVAISADADFVLTALAKHNIQQILATATEYRDRLGAERVQFLLNDRGEWEFNYLLTHNGAVIGTQKSFSRRERRLELMHEQAMGKADDATNPDVDPME